MTPSQKFLKKIGLKDQDNIEEATSNNNIADTRKIHAVLF